MRGEGAVGVEADQPNVGEGWVADLGSQISHSTHREAERYECPRWGNVHEHRAARRSEVRAAGQQLANNPWSARGRLVSARATKTG